MVAAPILLAMFMLTAGTDIYYGMYGYPVEKATQIAVQIAREELTRATELQEIVFCCFSEEDAEICSAKLA